MRFYVFNTKNDLPPQTVHKNLAYLLFTKSISISIPPFCILPYRTNTSIGLVFGEQASSIGSCSGGNTFFYRTQCQKMKTPGFEIGLAGISCPWCLFVYGKSLSHLRCYLGGMTVAMPLITVSPFWLVAIVSSSTRFFSAMISVTVQVTVTVSPKNTGLVNFSS